MNAQTNIRRRMTPGGLLRLNTTFSPFALSRVTHKHADDFLPALIHEGRNPLSTINLAAELLNQSSLDEEQKELIKMILRGSIRVNVLINSLLKPAQPLETALGLYPASQLLE